MIWSATFEQRLQAWHDVREQAQHDVTLEQALNRVNDWWWMAPMSPKPSWWQSTSWPDPWALLAQDGFCDLARALGIVYTVLMLEHPDITDVTLIQYDDHNLVHVNQGKYILNWCPRQLLNIHSLTITPRQHIDGKTLKNLLG